MVGGKSGSCWPIHSNRFTKSSAPMKSRISLWFPTAGMVLSSVYFQHIERGAPTPFYFKSIDICRYGWLSG